MIKHIVLCLFLITLFQSCKVGEKKVEKPNILFVLMDDLGYGQFGVYNDTISTSDFNPYFVQLVDSLQGYSLDKSLQFSKTAIPTLTHLAKEGQIFTRAFTSSNLCSPSRLGIVTATLQNKLGIYSNNDSEQSGLVQGTHLAENLKALDYQTAHIGKWHIGKRNYDIVKSILKEHGLDENLSIAKVKVEYPEVHEQIRRSGYLGSVVDEQNPINNGFDYYFGYNHWASEFYNDYNVWENFEHAGKQEGYNTDTFTDKALTFMETQIEQEHPFYVQLHYHAVHDSLEPIAPKKYLRKFDSNSQHLNNFYAHINGVDSNIKRIVEYLKSTNQYENTIIVFTSDNGAMAGGSYNGNKTGSPLPGNTPFSGHKGTYSQGGFRVPLFIHWPKGLKTNGIQHQMVSTMDILPTVIEAAGGEIPTGLDGKSLLDLMANKTTTPVHDHLLWAGLHSYKWGYLINKTTKTHDTESEFAPPAWVVIKDDYLLRFTGTLENGIYLDHLAGREPTIALFNIAKDPAEAHNLALQMPDVVEELSALYFKESRDFPPPVDWKRWKWEELREP